MPDKNVSPPLLKPLRTFETAQKEVRKVRAQRRALGICECGRGMKRAETEQCESCDLDGQANVRGHCPNCGNPGVKPYERSTIGPRWHCLHCGSEWCETAEIIDLDADHIRAWGGTR